MNFLVRVFFFVSFLAYSLGIGGASQRAVSGSLAILLIGAGMATGFLAFFFSCLGLLFSRKSGGRRDISITSFLAILLGLGQLAAAAYFYVVIVMPHPRINDVTTNFQDPPDFIGKDNGVHAIEGEEFLSAENTGRIYNPAFAPIQEAAYPDIKTSFFDYDAKFVYKAAVVTINQFPNWQMGITDAEKLHVEALEESETFHFVDDIVIQVKALGPEKSSLDMRSRSRGNPFDQGKNAARIREFLRKVEPAVRRIAEREKAKAALEATNAPPAGVDPVAGSVSSTPATPAPAPSPLPSTELAPAPASPPMPPPPAMAPTSNPILNRALGTGAADVGD